MASVFFDIDGTLLDRENVIEESTKEAVRLLKENGHSVYINSGRTRVFINNEELLAMDFDGLLCGCGTHIEYRGRELAYHPISRDVLEKTVDVFYHYDMPAVMEGRDTLFMDEELITRDPYGVRLLSMLEGHVQPIRKNQDNWEGSKFSVLIEDRDYKSAIAELDEYYNFMIHNERAMEAVPKGFSKATAVREICRLTDSDPEDTYAFGDSSNDADMLEYVNVGIAMGNSRPPALACADYITDDIHEDGIYNALKHFDLI